MRHRETRRWLRGCLLTGSLGITLSCGGGPTTPVARPGSIHVVVASGGSDVDHDGYTLQLDDQGAFTVGASTDTAFTEVDPGSHQVVLGGLADNCAVSGSNPRTVNVVAGERAEILLTVTCSAVTGTLQVTTATTGEPSVTSFSIELDGKTTQPVGANSQVSLSGLIPGDHVVFLGGVPSECSIAGDNPRSVTVQAGQAAAAAFTVGCPVVPRVAFVHATQEAGQQLWLMKPDGSARVQLTTNAVAAGPAWSPDRRKIAFNNFVSGTEQVYSIDLGRTGPTLLTHEGVNADPSWSPDGALLAFASNRDGDMELYTMSPDGSNPVRLTNSPGSDMQPEWSPDGTRIVFSSQRDGGEPEIYIMNADGTGQTRLTNNTDLDHQPTWSPDGGRIAFTSQRSGGRNQIFVMNPDGSDPVQLTTEPVGNNYPTWSPDGTKIIFTSLRHNLVGDLYVMNSDGSDQTALTQNPGTVADQDAAWAK